jgi:MFS family permease
VIFAAVVGLVLNANLTPGQMTDWGWRVPLLLGCLVIPLVLWLRRSLTETAEFSARRHRPQLPEVLASLANNWRIVSLGVLLVTMTTVSFYMITAYTPTFGTSVLHLSSLDSFIATLAVGASNLLWLPLMGAWSDRIGRRPLLIGCTVLMVLTAYPALVWLTRAPSLAALLATELWFSFLYASYNSAMVVCLTEIMPAEVRTTAFALAYSLATSLFGGFTPAICHLLVQYTHNPAVPGLWLMFAALCGLAAALLIGARPQDADGHRAAIIVP